MTDNDFDHEGTDTHEFTEQDLRTMRESLRRVQELENKEERIKETDSVIDEILKKRIVSS